MSFLVQREKMYTEIINFGQYLSNKNHHVIKDLSSMEIKVLIVEDNPITAQDIKEILVENSMNVIGIASNANQAINKTKKENPDIIIMDITLDGDIDGISVVKEIHKTEFFPVIYLTAKTDREHVERAFTTAPSAFLSKPFNEIDLINAIELAFVNHCKNIMDATDVPELSESLFLKKGDKYEKISVHDIIYIEADGSYCKVVTHSNSYSLSLNLQNVSKKINNPLFFRAHRSHIVNLECITGFDSNHIFINDKAIIYSKSNKESLMKHLQKL
ncbi:MAG: response regulator [Cyclobacteriaceae bacterium]|nr:response regulator [Cyclobacteriaceae bacterium]